MGVRASRIARRRRSGAALALWRGSPLEQLDGWLPAQSEAARLEELRRTRRGGLARRPPGRRRASPGRRRRRGAGERRAVAGASLDESGARPVPLRPPGRCAADRSLGRATSSSTSSASVPDRSWLDLEAAILRQDAALGSVVEPLAVSADCPYKGLASFDEADADTFFGRDAETCVSSDSAPTRSSSSPARRAAASRRWSAPGWSRRCGAGLRSSSYVVPGADPHATRGRRSAPRPRPVGRGRPVRGVVRPRSPARDAVSDLCRSLATHADGGGDRGRRHSQRPSRRARQPSSAQPARSSRVSTSSTPLTGDALREAIEQPAQLAGLRLEHGLVELLVRDCDGEPGGLPLLSHALVETWRRRDGSHADGRGLPQQRRHPGCGRPLGRPALRRPHGRRAGNAACCAAPPRHPVTRRRPGALPCAQPAACSATPVATASSGCWSVPASSRPRRDRSRSPTRRWPGRGPGCGAWLDEDVAGQRILRHLTAAADGWDTLGRPDTELYRGARLETALEWRDHALARSSPSSSSRSSTPPRNTPARSVGRSTQERRRTRGPSAVSAGCSS